MTIKKKQKKKVIAVKKGSTPLQVRLNPLVLVEVKKGLTPGWSISSYLRHLVMKDLEHKGITFDAYSWKES